MSLISSSPPPVPSSKQRLYRAMYLLRNLTACRPHRPFLRYVCTHKALVPLHGALAGVVEGLLKGCSSVVEGLLKGWNGWEGGGERERRDVKVFLRNGKVWNEWERGGGGPVLRKIVLDVLQPQIWYISFT